MWYPKHRRNVRYAKNKNNGEESEDKAHVDEAESTPMPNLDQIYFLQKLGLKEQKPSCQRSRVLDETYYTLNPNVPQIPLEVQNGKK
ncbi:hypothetical protein NPIL_558821 [Nephila pilipes]|uniref:Uncharacterized protein n=1 Tax=Nephila pilipes TaxID=299642 RepID=A0A8X6QEW5_NEPPI|nr:hypothetical protein NPIL_558821 [Nephila pilipes]